jgi:hydrogenase/urease accessory protein HupE
MKIIIFLLLIAWSLYAHQTGLSFLNLDVTSSKMIDVTYKKPLSDTRVMDIKIEYPSRCSQTLHPSTKIENGFIVTYFQMWCGKDALTNSKIWVKGLVRSDRGILIRYQDADMVKKAILREQTPFIDLSLQQSRWELMGEYISLGVFHILSGYDHLMFVMLLFLLSSSLRALLFTVTAFTLSHSITLTCGILGIVYMPPPFIESMIALSIIFLAKELYLEHESFTKRHLGIVAFSFGLLHGFGFSSALKDIGLPQSEIPLSLFSFNVGIELGQLLFIFSLSLAFYIAGKFMKDVRKYDKIIAYCTGSLASFWFIQRVLSF